MAVHDGIDGHIAKAVLFFLLVAVIAAAQLWLTHRGEVEG